MQNNVLLQVGVKILLKNREGKYLLVHRSKEKYPDTKGAWDIVGGRINPGRPLLENLQREVTEETGLRIVGEPVLVAAQDIMPNETRHIVRLTYIGSAEGEVVLDTTENDEYKWYSAQELLTLEDIDIYVKELLQKVL